MSGPIQACYAVYVFLFVKGLFTFLTCTSSGVSWIVFSFARLILHLLFIYIEEKKGKLKCQMLKYRFKRKLGSELIILAISVLYHQLQNVPTGNKMFS